MDLFINSGKIVCLFLSSDLVPVLASQAVIFIGSSAQNHYVILMSSLVHFSVNCWRSMEACFILFLK